MFFKLNLSFNMLCIRMLSFRSLCSVSLFTFPDSILLNFRKRALHTEKRKRKSPLHTNRNFWKYKFWTVRAKRPLPHPPLCLLWRDRKYQIIRNLPFQFLVELHVSLVDVVNICVRVMSSSSGKLLSFLLLRLDI